MKSVLDNTEDLAIVESVIGLTRAFNRKLMAEGVETAEIGMLLLNMGCQVGQGYCIAHPMLADTVPAWTAAFVPEPDWSSAATYFSREDMPFFMAELQHRSWVRQLAEWLAGVPETPMSMSLDYRNCRFGMWYSTEGKKRYGHYAAFAAIGEAHEAVHQLGQELVRLHAAGRNDEVHTRLGELIVLRDQLIEGLATLQAEIVVEKM